MVFKVTFDGKLLRTPWPVTRVRLIATMAFLEMLIELKTSNESLLTAVVKAFKYIGVNMSVMVLL